MADHEGATGTHLLTDPELVSGIVETSPIGITVVDAAGEITFVNERAEEIYGRSRDEINAHDDARLDLVDENGDPLGPGELPFDRVVKEGEPIYDQLLGLRRPTGERVWVSVNGAPQWTDHGELKRAVFAVEDVTETHELAAELDELLGRVTDAFYALDDEWRFTHANERATELIDFEGDGLVGKHVWETFEWAADSVLREEYERAMATGEPTSFEFYYPEPLETWFEVSAYPSDSGLSVYFRDITDRKEREIEHAEMVRELREAKTQLEAATEAASVGTWEWHVQCDELVMGPTFAEKFGVDPERAQDGVPLDRFVRAIHDDDRERVEAAIDVALETCGEYEAEYRIWDDDGDVRWVVARGRVECDDTGTPSTFPGAITDITDRKRAELELARHRDQFQSLFEILPVGVVVATADGELIEANETAKELWGGDVFDAASIEEYDKFDAVWADSGEPVETDEWTLSRVLRGEEAIDPDVFEITAFDGQTRTIMVHGMPVRDQQGAVRRAVATMTDITERKEYQRQLEASNERLEQFAYAASHDLQEPLRMVSSYLKLLENRYGDVLDDEGKEFLAFAVDGADRMRDMIDGLLAYSRVESRGDPFEPLDLDDVLAAARQDLQVKIAESNAEITAADLPRVEGDADQLRQVFQNLLDNAIEYSGDEPPRIQISADRDGGMWQLAVRDAGIGIDPDDADRVFELFYRLHGQDEHAGTGIGLALCNRIVERHGGDIWIDSDPGEGTTVVLSLPAATDRIDE